MFSQTENEAVGSIEKILQDLDEELNYEEAYEELIRLSKQKVDLNNSSYEELQRLFFLSEFQLVSILEYAERGEGFLSVYELQTLTGFVPQVIENLLPFVCVSPKKSRHEDKKHQTLYHKSEAIIRFSRVLEEQKAYSDSKAIYLGSPVKFLARYSYEMDKQLLFGFTTEKDPGERFGFGEKQFGNDFNSAFLQLRGKKWADQLIFGDYKALFGQGLVLGSASSFNASASCSNNFARGQSYKKSSSADEYGYFRGLAYSKKVKRIALNMHLSFKKLDARIVDSIKQKPVFSSINRSGIHASKTELLRKHNLNEYGSGFNMNYTKASFSIGGNVNLYAYGGIPQQPEAIYQQSAKEHQVNLNYSFDYKWRLRNVIFYGENALNRFFAPACINGFVLLLNNQLSFQLSQRYFSQFYYNVYGSSIQQSSTLNNEKGIYSGIEFTPGDKLKLAAYIDFYSFPWLKFTVNKPSKGNEYYSFLHYRFHKNLSIKLLYKEETKEGNAQEAKSEFEVFTQRKARADADFSISDQLDIKFRFEQNILFSSLHSSEKGFLSYATIIYKFSRLPLKVYARFSIFDTDSYRSRIYAYENDVLYGFSVPAFFDQGTRHFFLVNYEANQNISFWFRIAQTNYAERAYIGSGNSEIAGDRKTELKLQCRIKFDGKALFNK